MTKPEFVNLYSYSMVGAGTVQLDLGYVPPGKEVATDNYTIHLVFDMAVLSMIAQHHLNIEAQLDAARAAAAEAAAATKN